MVIQGFNCLWVWISMVMWGTISSYSKLNIWKIANYEGGSRNGGGGGGVKAKCFEPLLISLHTVPRCNYPCVWLEDGRKWHKVDICQAKQNINTKDAAWDGSRQCCLQKLFCHILRYPWDKGDPVWWWGLGSSLPTGALITPMDIQAWNLGQALFSFLGKSVHFLFFLHLRERFWIHPCSLISKNHLQIKDLR